MMKRVLIGLLMGLATVACFAALVFCMGASLLWLTEHFGIWWAMGIWGAILSVAFGLMFAFAPEAFGDLK